MNFYIFRHVTYPIVITSALELCCDLFNTFPRTHLYLHLLLPLVSNKAIQKPLVKCFRIVLQHLPRQYGSISFLLNSSKRVKHDEHNNFKFSSFSLEENVFSVNMNFLPFPLLTSPDKSIPSAVYNVFSSLCQGAFAISDPQSLFLPNNTNNVDEQISLICSNLNRLLMVCLYVLIYIFQTLMFIVI